MHLGRRLGNPLGSSQPLSLPGLEPRSPFLDMRIAFAHSNTVRLWMEVDRFEYLTHLYKNGGYAQTKNVQFTPLSAYIAFDVEDTGGDAIFTASIYRRDNPASVYYSTELQLTGAGITELSSKNSSQSVTNISGNWFKVIMNLSRPLDDQFKLNFAISGGDTRVGSAEISGDPFANEALRLNLDADLANWTPALVVNGTTGSGDTAYDLTDGNVAFHDLFKFIVSFDEQITGLDRHCFSAVFSGPSQSTEGPELEARGILPFCPDNRVHLKWPASISGVAAVIIEAAKDSDVFVPIASVAPNMLEYTTAGLPLGVWRFRLRAQDVAGNISDVVSLADFNPTTWFDPFDPSVMFTNTGGTVNVLNDGDKVARIDNKGSIGAFLQQPTAGNCPVFNSTTIAYGAGIKVNNATSFMNGGPASAWIGGGQQFDVYMSLVILSILPTTPPDSLSTNQFSNIFCFQSFFELIVADFSDNYFTNPEDDENRGAGIIARMQTGSGQVAVVLPVIMNERTFIRATYDGTNLRLYVSGNVAIAAAPGPTAPTAALFWGTGGASKGVNALVGPIVSFQTPRSDIVAQQIMDLIIVESTAPTTFIIPESLTAPVNMQIIFAGTNGNVFSNVSSSPSVTTYNIYHNGGTAEFPDFSAPAASGAAPSFILAMAPGLWRFVIRASDGTKEDSNFENRLDISVIESSPGILEVAGPAPNSVSQFEITLEPNGFVKITAKYDAKRENAIGNSVHVWFFEANTKADFSQIPISIFSIPVHAKGLNSVYSLGPVIVGPFSQVEHYAVPRVMSSEGVFETSNPVKIMFTPSSTKPFPLLGLRGNQC